MTHHKKPEISKRLGRIEGHVRGIQTMVNEDKSYAERSGIDISLKDAVTLLSQITCDKR